MYSKINDIVDWWNAYFHYSADQMIHNYSLVVIFYFVANIILPYTATHLYLANDN